MDHRERCRPNLRHEPLFLLRPLERASVLPQDWTFGKAQHQGTQTVARDEKGCVKVADNLYRRHDSPNLYIVWHQGGRHRWKSTKTSLVKEAKRLRDEFLTRGRASGLTRDERVTYEQIR